VPPPAGRRTPPGTPRRRPGHERQRRRGRLGVSAAGGLTLDELLERQGLTARWREEALRVVLNEEVARGRVAVDGEGRYRLVRERFDPAVLEGLRLLPR
jgi:hypothetical protein